MENICRLWRPIELTDKWKACDTSILDDISSSWFERRTKLREDLGEYADFLNRLKREHAIETGIIERLYDLNRGITEVFIKEGFIKSALSHGDTNIAAGDLINHLNDHLAAVNFVFDVVKEDRLLSTSFIKELHQLITRNQNFAKGKDQFGNTLDTKLLKGEYKRTENNPTRDDGTKIFYCPPEQVASEMDNLISIYKNNAKIHPLILATWFHHAFTTIHPFQDGNGRIARLLASLIFIKNKYFPFTVLREEAKVKYIEALEKADKGEPQSLVTYFGEVQKRNIQKALNLKDVTSTSLEEVQNIFASKVENRKTQKVKEHQELISTTRTVVFKYCCQVLNELKDSLEIKLHGNADVSIASCSFENKKTQHYFSQQIIGYAIKHDYFFNRSLPKAWLMFKIDMGENKKYQVGISIHHYGYNDTTIAIGSFLEFKGSKRDEKLDTTLPLDIPPHVISISENIDAKKKNIRAYLENALAIALGQIASEI
jgi:Fic family protein